MADDLDFEIVKKPTAAPAPGGSSDFEIVSRGKSEPNIFARYWDGLLQGKSLLGGETPLAESSRLSQEAERRYPVQPEMSYGEKLGQYRRQIGDRPQLDNPMVGAFGPQNMRAVGGVAGRLWDQLIGGGASSKASPAQQRLADYEAAGITPNVPAVGQSPAAGFATKVANLAPGGAVPRALERTQQETSAAIDREASKYGAAADRFAGGNIARNAMQRFFADRSESEQNYNEFFRIMHGAPPVELPNTLRTLRGFMGRFESEPQLRGLFTKPVIQNLARILEPRTETIPAKTSGMLDQFGNPAVITPAQTVKRGGALTVPEIKELRTQLGYLLDNPSVGGEEIPKAQVRQLYGSLTQDMRSAATKRGPAAAKALANATTSYALRQRQMERLAPLMTPQAPERTLAIIENAARGDTNLLQAARRVMAPEEWGNVGASLIRGLGRVPSAVGDESPFSVKTFATNWGKLSPRAKDLLFGDEPNRAGLERLARIASSERSVEKYRLPPMAQGVASGAVITSIVDALMSGNLGIGATGLAAAGGTYGLGRMLMSPQFTRWLYAAPKIIGSGDPQTAFQRGAQSLEAALRNEDIEESATPQKSRAPATPVVPPRPSRKAVSKSDDTIEPPPRDPLPSVGGP